MNENENKDIIETLEKRTKLLLILLICTLAVSAAGIVLQFVSPFARGGTMRISGGGSLPNFSQGETYTQE